MGSAVRMDHLFHFVTCMHVLSMCLLLVQSQQRSGARVQGSPARDGGLQVPLPQQESRHRVVRAQLLLPLRKHSVRAGCGRAAEQGLQDLQGGSGGLGGATAAQRRPLLPMSFLCSALCIISYLLYVIGCVERESSSRLCVDYLILIQFFRP